MKVIQLPDVLHEYLVHVIESHAGKGIHPEEGVAVARLYEAVTKNATHIDDTEVRKMAAAASPLGQSVPGVVAEVQELESRVETAVREKVYNEAGVPPPRKPEHWETNVHPEDR